MYAVAQVQYYFTTKVGDKLGVFGFVGMLYSCVVKQHYGKSIYKVSEHQTHECARTDLGGRVALPISKIEAKL